MYACAHAAGAVAYVEVEVIAVSLEEHGDGAIVSALVQRRTRDVEGSVVNPQLHHHGVLAFEDDDGAAGTPQAAAVAPRETRADVEERLALLLARLPCTYTCTAGACM